MGGECVSVYLKVGRGGLKRESGAVDPSKSRTASGRSVSLLRCPLVPVDRSTLPKEGTMCYDIIKKRKATKTTNRTSHGHDNHTTKHIRTAPALSRTNYLNFVWGHVCSLCERVDSCILSTEIKWTTINSTFVTISIPQRGTNKKCQEQKAFQQQHVPAGNLSTNEG